jgi:hypothetical protein
MFESCVNIFGLRPPPHPKHVYTEEQICAAYKYNSAPRSVAQQTVNLFFEFLHIQSNRRKKALLSW